jgi:hypothetical protein
MRLCLGYAFCGNAATVYYKGAYCGRCADRKWGSQPTMLAALELSNVARTLDPVRPQERLPSGAVSVLGAGVRDGLPVPPRTSAPSPSDEFYDLLDAKGWDMVDLEAALIEFLEAG